MTATSAFVFDSSDDEYGNERVCVSARAAKAKRYLGEKYEYDGDEWVKKVFKDDEFIKKHG